MVQPLPTSTTSMVRVEVDGSRRRRALAARDDVPARIAVAVAEAPSARTHLDWRSPRLPAGAAR